MTPTRLTAVLTHPAQYMSPWFRHIASRCPAIDLSVLHVIEPTAEQQGVGFGVPFHWDRSLTEGFRCRTVRAARPGDSVDSARFWGLDAPEIGAAVARTEPDVVLIPGWHSIALVRALLACRRRGIPVLYRGDTHAGSAPPGWRRPLWAAKSRLMLRLFDGYLSVGANARRYLRRHAPRSRPLVDVPHAVDAEYFARSAAPHQMPEARAVARAAWGLGPGDWVVLFAGKLEDKKRPLDLIRAIARMRPGARLLVAGTGPLEDACRTEARRAGVAAAWAGFLNQSELGRAYAVADCLALPSDERETWGLVVNEALATGLPCVVSDRVGCAPDLVTEGTGRVFPMGDVAALAAALDAVRARRDAGHDWAPACRALGRAHSFERATAGLVTACAGVARIARPLPATRVVAACAGMVVVGGLERMVFRTLGALREGGALVHCVVNSWENHRIADLATSIGATWSVGYTAERLERGAGLCARLGQARDVVRSSVSFLARARRVRATHVLVSEYAAALLLWPALFLLRASGARVVLDLQNAPAPGAFHRRLWRRAIAPVVDRFVCCSEDSRRRLLAHGVLGDRISVVHNVAFHQPDNGDAPPRDPRAIAYVGQVIPEKGLDLLLDAVGLLVARGHDARLVVAGAMDGWVAPSYAGYRERLLERASAADLSGRVQFLGWRDDVAAILSGAGVHCCPSRPEMLEGMPLVCLEAKLAGLPSVVFPVGPLPEIVSHDDDGWVCRDVSAAALAEGLERFVADPVRRERAGQRARESSQRFDPERFAAAWRALFGLGAGGRR